jgi:hypothetical protein
MAAAIAARCSTMHNIAHMCLATLLLQAVPGDLRARHALADMYQARAFALKDSDGKSLLLLSSM